MTDPRKTIAITAIGVISPYGTGNELLERALIAGQSCLGPLRNFSPGFPVMCGEITGPLALECRPGSWFSRTDRLAVLAAQDAVCGPDGRADVVPECGVVMASTVAGLSELAPEMMKDPAAWYRSGGLERAATYPVYRVSNAVGDRFGLLGPRLAVNVACASGAMSIALAANLLLDGTAPMMLAGGSDALCPFTASGFHSLQALDPEPCRPFDRHRAGLNIGEGAAVLRLETLEGARRRNAPVLAILLGWAMTNDAHHLTAPHEHGRGAADCIRWAMEIARVDLDEVGYVNAHGTGTPLNDAAETKAYEAAFGGRSKPVPVSSTKSYFGHCLGAAGSLEAAVTIAAIRHGALFPTLRLREPIEAPAIDWLMGETRRQPVSTAVTLSAGFGGSNTALVFGAAQ